MNTKTLNRLFFDNYGAKLAEVSRLVDCRSYREISGKCNTAFCESKEIPHVARHALKALQEINPTGGAANGKAAGGGEC